MTTARQCLATYGSTLIMPMSIRRPEYFREVVGGPRAATPACHHCRLTASAATLEARIRASGEAVGWRLDHLLPCATALAAPEFASHVATDEKTPRRWPPSTLMRISPLR